MTRPNQTDKLTNLTCYFFAIAIHCYAKLFYFLWQSFNVSLCRQTATWILTFVGENHPSFECGLTMTWRRHSILITYTRPYQSEWIKCLSR